MIHSLNQALLIDCCGDFNEMSLTESSGGSSLMKFRGKFQEANAINKNKRMYPYSVLDVNVRRLGDMLRERKLTGELDHPSDSIVHLATASHLITKLWWEGNTLMGEGEILNTPHGKVLRALINDGVKVGISSRGVGSGETNEQGILVIGESFKLITFDAVADPSTYEAYQEKVASGRRRTESIAPAQQNIPVYSNEFTRIPSINESRGIDMASALTACLGGMVKTRTDHIRRGISI